MLNKMDFVFTIFVVCTVLIICFTPSNRFTSTYRVRTLLVQVIKMNNKNKKIKNTLNIANITKLTRKFSKRVYISSKILCHWHKKIIEIQLFRDVINIKVFKIAVLE